jgi:redox-sensitive bicupin YhaK (pirin superfamily)
VLQGELEVNGVKASAGDGLHVEKEENLTFQSEAESEMLLFDLA